MAEVTHAGRGWTVEFDAHEATLTTADGTTTFQSVDLADVRVHFAWLRWVLKHGDDTVCLLRGARRRKARHLQRDIDELAVGAIRQWYERVHEVIERARHEQRWVPCETIDELVESRPSASEHKKGWIGPLTGDDEAAIEFLPTNLRQLFDDVNRTTLDSELRSRRRFFDRIESSPLTDEQASAVVTFDNRVHVIAAAGSGKTSVMVARAAYAVQRGFVAADRILLLAFNKAAAAELQRRIDARFAAAGIDATGVRASTFHAFGLEVIGRATGSKPRLAPWLETGQDTKMLGRIVDDLRDRSTEFRYKWDLFRLLYGNAPTEVDGGTPDGYDRSTSTTGFVTYSGHPVRSAGERMIANWLFLNGINYEYERRYDVHVADETHSQYHPDFFYPDVDIWHEHWALDRDGNPPAEFVGYADDIRWKRALHKEHGSTLVESTWADVMFGDGLSDLQRDLERHGVEFDWNPDRPIPGAQPLKHADLVRLVRTFMTHVKSNSLDVASVLDRAESDRRLRGFRTRLFLDVYWPIHEEWDRRLRAEGYVDFEDMLVLAADHLAAGAVDPGVDLVMVDEFQDASHARARLVQGLVRPTGKFVLAVGDDWQSINRFAGADISVMTGFEQWFGAGPTLRLSTTFRCPQTICDVASSFVSRNPRQLRKDVRSALPDPGPPVQVIRAVNAGAAIDAYLRRLSASVANGTVEPGRDGQVTVDILGRYRFDEDLVASEPPGNLHVTYRTAHGSKGLEADFIVVARMESGTYGFPSEISDDPVLDLAMAEPDDFPNAEERRLFYVALTRARRQVTIVTTQGRESAFVVELLNDGNATVIGVDGEPEVEVETCKVCQKGTMVRRSGPYGAFLGCSTFPACRSTRNLTAP